MTPFLPDVNVLVALIDSAHLHHEAAHAWFASEGHKAWATCPLSENGVLRIVGQPRYPNSPGTAASVARLMKRFCALPGHVFWPDDVTLLDGGRVEVERLLTAAQVTDTYLLALALAHGGRLATFDRRLIVDAVIDGARGLHIIN